MICHIFGFEYTFVDCKSKIIKYVDGDDDSARMRGYYCFLNITCVRRSNWLLRREWKVSARRGEDVLTFFGF